MQRDHSYVFAQGYSVDQALSCGDILSHAQNNSFVRDVSCQVYAMEDVLDSTTSIHCPRLEMASRSKLSCVCWNSYIKHLLLAADYDGCLSLWDAQGNVCTGNFDDHGKRVWSADFSTVS